MTAPVATTRRTAADWRETAVTAVWNVIFAYLCFGWLSIVPGFISLAGDNQGLQIGSWSAFGLWGLLFLVVMCDD